MNFRSFKSIAVILGTVCGTAIILQTYMRKNATYLSSTRNRLNMTTLQYFCEATTLGCFSGISTVENHKFMTRHIWMDSSMCLKFCSDKEMKYAFLSHGDTCFCVESFPPLPQRKPLPEKGICNISCHSGEENCGGSQSVRAFLLKVPCVQAPFNDEHVKVHLLGCFKFTSSQHSFNGFTVDSQNQCLLACEMERRALAIFREHSECWCGQMNARFNLTHKAQTCQASHYQVYRTTFEDQRCGDIGLLEVGTHNTTALISFPGSGNTWTRYLLAKATGFHTGSVYHDASLYNSGFLGELLHPNDMRTDFIKSHHHNAKELQVILIIRNPFRAIIAMAQPHHTGVATQTRLKKTIKVKFRRFEMLWKTYVESLVAAKKPFLVVYYEDLVEDPIAKVREMVEFASKANPALVPTNLEQRLACLSQETTGLQKRKSTANYTVGALFEKEAVLKIIDDVRAIRKILKQAGVEKELPPYESELF